MKRTEPPGGLSIAQWGSGFQDKAHRDSSTVSSCWTVCFACCQPRRWDLSESFQCLLLLSQNSSELTAPGNSDNYLATNLEDKKEGCLMIVELGVRKAASKYSIEKAPVGCSFALKASESAETSLFLVHLKTCL